jgi:hypothetical protein
VEANNELTDTETSRTIWSTYYTLKCKPTQQMF